MTTLAVTNTRRPFNILPWIVLLAIAGLAIAGLMAASTPSISEMQQVKIDWLTIEVDVSESHAVDRHGSDALRVRECMDSGNIHSTWWNPYSGKYILVCNLDGDDVTWGVRIVRRVGTKWKEVTAFIRRQATSWSDMEEYLLDGGDVLTWIAPK